MMHPFATQAKNSGGYHGVSPIAPQCEFYPGVALNVHHYWTQAARVLHNRVQACANATEHLYYAAVYVSNL